MRNRNSVGKTSGKSLKNKDCKRIWLITTNDNINAIKFYQKCGFVFSAVYCDAIKNSRRIKPEIPLIGNFNIPIRDELEFELILTE